MSVIAFRQPLWVAKEAARDWDTAGTESGERDDSWPFDYSSLFIPQHGDICLIGNCEHRLFVLFEYGQVPWGKGNAAAPSDGATGEQIAACRVGVGEVRRST